jgi:hypothetical protein
MKKAYLIRMSEDGNDKYIFTNVKALFNRINELNYSANYICTLDNNNKWINVKFTYSNLVKALKDGCGYNLDIYPDKDANGYASLEIQEMIISSK